MREQKRKQNLSRGQREYFKDSQMLDSHNELQVFYHATDANFDAFDKKFIGMGHGSSFGEGFYFSSDPIPSYGENLAVYLDVKQPFVLDLKNENTVFDFADKLGIDKEMLKDFITYYDGSMKGAIGKTLRESYAEDLQGLKDKGYDGLVILNTSVGRYGEPKQAIEKEVVVFEPNQIKAINNLYPTAADNFKDNSKDYLRQHLKNLSVDEACAIAKHIKQTDIQNRKQSVKTKSRSDRDEI